MVYPPPPPGKRKDKHSDPLGVIVVTAGKDLTATIVSQAQTPVFHSCNFHDIYFFLKNYF